MRDDAGNDEPFDRFGKLTASKLRSALSLPKG
jgi:hypothetical protein